MTIPVDGYYYNKQIKKYVLQFMAIFSGVQVSVGKNNELEERLIPVPIHYADKDRVVSALLADNVQTSPIRLPLMSANITSIAQSPMRQHGVGTERRSSYVPVGGMLPNDLQVIYQRAPTPYDISVELKIMTSNADHHFQILEQIMPLFDPQMTIQTSDALFDMTKIASVKMESGPQFDPYPLDNTRRIVSSTMNFKIEAYIDTPAAIRHNYIERIKLRVAAVPSDTDLANFDIAFEFDKMGIPYEQINKDQEPL